MNKRILLAAVAIMLAFPAALAAQSKKTPPKSPATSVATSKTNKGLAETTCDGALDIVPSQASSFTRKRRPARTKDSEQKPEKKIEGNVQNPS